jgi:hypothetical protein
VRPSSDIPGRDAALVRGMIHVSLIVEGWTANIRSLGKHRCGHCAMFFVEDVGKSTDN